jgi:serine O-acetyltransferase
MYNSKSRFFRRLIRLVLRVIYGCEIPAEVELGENVWFEHQGSGVVLHPKVKIGNNITIMQHVAIGGRNGIETVPIIEDNVLIGGNACVLGPVRIGKGAKIGAGAVVVKDVPADATVVPQMRYILAEKVDA